MGEYTPRPSALQLLIGLGGVALGAYCIKAAYCVGKEADLWIGIALAALVVVSWGMLPWADVRGKEGAHIEKWVWRLAWIGVLGVVVANGVSYSAHYRMKQAGDAEVKIEAYEDAAKDKARAEAELATLKQNTRWEATKGCSAAKGEKAMEYCAKVSKAQSAIASAAAIKRQGRPASADAGVETIAWVTGVDPKKVGRSIPISWALVSDLIASLCLKSVLSAPKRRKGEQEKRNETPGTLRVVPGPEAPNPAKELADLRWAQHRAKGKSRQEATR